MVGVNHTLVFAASALSSRTPIESLTHAIRLSELLARPGVIVVDAGRCGNQRQQHEHQRCAKAKGAAASS
jgi:hypothetical protein